MFEFKQLLFQNVSRPVNTTSFRGLVIKSDKKYINFFSFRSFGVLFFLSQVRFLPLKRKIE